MILAMLPLIRQNFSKYLEHSLKGASYVLQEIIETIPASMFTKELAPTVRKYIEENSSKNLILLNDQILKDPKRGTVLRACFDTYRNSKTSDIPEFLKETTKNTLQMFGSKKELLSFA